MYLSLLLTQSEGFDQFTIAVDVLVVEILQEFTTTTYHFGQATSCTEVLAVLLQMLGEVTDAIGEQSYLAFDRTGVSSRLSVLLEDFFLLS